MKQTAQKLYLQQLVNESSTFKVPHYMKVTINRLYFYFSDTFSPNSLSYTTQKLFLTQLINESSSTLKTPHNMKVTIKTDSIYIFQRSTQQLEG